MVKNIISAVSVNGNLIKGTDALYDYPFICLTDFEDNQVSISKFYKMKTEDYRDSLGVISYADITKLDLKVVKRMHGARVTFIRAYYNFELHVTVNNGDEWNIEIAPIYEIKNILDTISKYTKVNDIIGAFTTFPTEKEFYALTDNEKVQPITYYLANTNREDFQKYCNTHYDEWVKTYHFDQGRITYPDRGLI